MYFNLSAGFSHGALERISRHENHCTHLIILAVFALVMGITYVIVDARSSSASNGFGPGNEGFTRANGAPPAFPEGGRFESLGGVRESHGERDGGGWLFGALRNIAIIGIIVALIAVPKSWIQKRKRAAQVAA